MNRAIILLVLCVACGGGGSTEPTAPPPIASPTPVNPVTPAVVPPNLTFTSSARTKGSTQDVVTTGLKNTGGDGSFRIEFYASPLNVVNATDKVIATTDIVTVAASYAQTVTWTIPRQAGYSSITSAVLFSRDLNSAVFRETGHVAFQ